MVEEKRYTSTCWCSGGGERKYVYGGIRRRVSAAWGNYKKCNGVLVIKDDRGIYRTEERPHCMVQRHG